MKKADSNSSSTVSLTEHLSALLDDEAGSFEERRVLDELTSNNNLRQKLSSYSLIGESMRSGQASITAGTSFLSGIQDEINSDSTYSDVLISDAVNDISSNESHAAESSNDDRKNAWLRSTGSFALAASVAAVAVIGFQNFQTYQQSDLIASTSVASAPEANTLVDKTIQLRSQKDNLTLEEMASATVVSADALNMPEKLASLDKSSTTKYKQADKQTRTRLMRYVDSHMKHASTTAFASSMYVAFAN